MIYTHVLDRAPSAFEAACMVRRAVNEAVRASGFAKRTTCHTFCHSFATHLVARGTDNRTLHEPLGHADDSTMSGRTGTMTSGYLNARKTIASARRRRLRSGVEDSGWAWRVTPSLGQSETSATSPRSALDSGGDA
ncbi:MAG: tyrosine-type recombinase/integrase [Polyangiaceae bacterium]